MAGAITGVAQCVDDALVILGLGRPEVAPENIVWLCSGCLNYRWQGSDAPARCPACDHSHFQRESGT